MMLAINDNDDDEELQFLEDLQRKENDDDDLDLIILLPFLYKNLNRRNSALFRKRWDSHYLVNLAVNERSFVSEYRVDPWRV